MPDYRVKEIHLTLQGEGFNTGIAVVLLRFEGCNLSCGFCDTDYIGTDGEGGGIYRTPQELAAAVETRWRNSLFPVNVLCTGGEPLLQLNEDLITEFHRKGFRILVETNGTLTAPEGIDWLCVSPKGGIPLQTSGNELKILWPPSNSDPDQYLMLEFDHFFIQPIRNEFYEGNLASAIQYCKQNPIWRLSLQTHRYTGIR